MLTDYKDIYWQKLNTGELWLQYCSLCKKYIFYPRGLCPYCLESGLEWKAVSGQGHVYSYAIVYVTALPEFNEEIPYIYALIELAEGIRLPSKLLDCPLNEVQVGMPVKLSFIEKEDRKLPVFTPAR
jgi:hypothetical protein